jgi:soluble lytic murein transglycosylase-like protein
MVIKTACFTGLLAFCASAETVGSRSTMVVRADAHSGRLVRSVLVVPRAADAGAAIKEAEDPEVKPPAPTSLFELIDAIAGQHEVEAELVHSVIKAESNYNPAAISPKGAQGLMQLIPSTARRFGVANTFNAQQNIEGGVKYLKYLMELYHNDYVKVIAAYNAGEGAVTKYGGIPPYAETVNYVYAVGRNLKNARAATEQKSKPAQVAAKAPESNPSTYGRIESVVTSDGKVYYKTQ